MLAAHMGAGEPQLMAQAVGQGQPRLDLDLDLFAVDLEADWHGVTGMFRAARGRRS